MKLPWAKILGYSAAVAIAAMVGGMVWQDSNRAKQRRMKAEAATQVAPQAQVTIPNLSTFVVEKIARIKEGDATVMAHLGDAAAKAINVDADCAGQPIEMYRVQGQPGQVGLILSCAK